MDKSTDILEMSDDDFAKLSAPEVVVSEDTPAPVVEQQVDVPPVVDPVVPEAEVNDPAAQVDPVADDVPPAVDPVDTPPPVEADAPATDPVVVAEEAPIEVDYKAAYEELLKPIKANGKEIQLKSHAELVQLAQQGANYTRKMQDIAPHRKTLLMLENNDLLDPEKLSFLIDLSKKDPAAIQKLIKESGVNPLDIDVEAEPTYKGGNHRVTDEQAAFANAIEDMQMSDSGNTVLKSIHSTWDQASIGMLATQPGILEIMRTQHEQGFYDRIATEVERQRTLGAIPASQTWLQSYKSVGDAMVKAGAFDDLLANQQPATQNPPAAQTPVVTRVAAPKPEVVPNPKAEAAAATRNTPNAAKTVTNPLAMSDEAFMQQFQNRL